MPSLAAHEQILPISESFKQIKTFVPENIDFSIYNHLADLPQFNPDFASENILQIVLQLLAEIENVAGIVICTPEYVFSLPGSLKNLLERTVATTIFSDKPVDTITAVASGVKAQESLLLILQTLGARLDGKTQLLIQGAKSKVDSEGNIKDEQNRTEIRNPDRTLCPLADLRFYLKTVTCPCTELLSVVLSGPGPSTSIV